MPKNGTRWNSSREGSISEWDDNDNRYGKNRNRDFDNDVNERRNDGYGSNRMGRPNDNINQQNSSYSTGQPGNDYNDMYDTDYGNYSRGSNANMNRDNYYPGRDNNWNRTSNRYDRGNEWSGRPGYAGADYGNYTDRYGNENRGNNRSWWDKTKDEVSSWFGDDEADLRRRMDERKGRHRGKGPKGYTRSDERIKDDVNDRLSDDSHVDASDIDVTVTNCEVTLTGTVNSRWEKRHAEDIAESVSGVKNVENRLRVNSNPQGLSDTSYGMSYGPVDAR